MCKYDAQGRKLIKKKKKLRVRAAITEIRSAVEIIRYVVEYTRQLVVFGYPRDRGLGIAFTSEFQNQLEEYQIV